MLRTQSVATAHQGQPDKPSRQVSEQAGGRRSFLERSTQQIVEIRLAYMMDRKCKECESAFKFVHTGPGSSDTGRGDVRQGWWTIRQWLYGKVSDSGRGVSDSGRGVSDSGRGVSDSGRGVPDSGDSVSPEDTLRQIDVICCQIRAKGVIIAWKLFVIKLKFGVALDTEHRWCHHRAEHRIQSAQMFQ